MASNAKEILLVDAVLWSDAFALTDPLRSAPRWFEPHVSDPGRVQMRSVSAEADLSAEPGPQVRGVVISGSPRDAWSSDPVNTALCQLIDRCHQRGVPLLGVCYGHQVLGRALGAKVAPHPDGWELGNVTIQLTEEGRRSRLFETLPTTFDALQSHRDAVIELPPGCELLATGAHTRIQSFAFDNLLFGVQFHPEARPDILRYLWGPRLERWRGQIGFDLDHRLTTFQEVPESALVLNRFVNHIAH